MIESLLYMTARDLFQSVLVTALASGFIVSSFVMNGEDTVERDTPAIMQLQTEAPPSGANVTEETPPVRVIEQPEMPGSKSDAGAALERPALSHGEEVRHYLWQVYQRSSTKSDSHGEFTWKDAVAAERIGLSVEDYVIGGMDPDFRELLFAAGRSMDAAGIDWTILSAFRDDYRQSLAAGYKAQGGNSFHGGSLATGGYGHGCAVDIAATNNLLNNAAWNWLDQNGERFGLLRPLRGIDPAHVQTMTGWHQIAAGLRTRGSGMDTALGTQNDAPDTAPGKADEEIRVQPADLVDINITEVQFDCIRVRPAPAPEADNAVADRPAGNHPMFYRPVSNHPMFYRPVGNHPIRVAGPPSKFFVRISSTSVEIHRSFKAVSKATGTGATRRLSNRRPPGAGGNRHARFTESADFTG